jgi:quercetin dioxygenase-like cupin family protein
MRFLLAFFLVCAAAAAQTETPVQTPVSTLIARTNTTIIGQKNIVPKNPDVAATIITFAPGVRTAEHKHLYPHYALVEAGTLTIVNTQTGKSYEVKAGEFFLEMIDTWHYGINQGNEPVKLVIIDLVPHGVKTNSVPKPAPHK